MNRDELRPIAETLLRAHTCPGVLSRHLSDVLATATPRKLEDREELCTEGDPGESLFFLLKGKVRVMQRDPEGWQRELAIMNAPAMIGHMSLVDNSKRSATCVADGPCAVGVLDRRSYNEIMGEPSPRGAAMRRLLLASLTRQLTGANERIRKLIAPSLENESDVGADDLASVAGILGGWKITADDLAATDQMDVVYTDEQKRNRPKGWR